jgi:ribonuclease T2
MPKIVAALVLWLALAWPAAAQENERPGAFDYYVLALSWSPQFCASHGGEAQCAQSFGFVVHGLWPENNDGSWPDSCRPAATVPARTADRVRPFMPSQRLIDHEWARHGTCSGLAMDDYFDALGQAFRKVQIPQPLRAPRQRLALSVERLKQLFAEANPGLAANMLAADCAGGPMLAELRVCLDKSLAFRPCGGGLDDSCKGRELRITPIN